MHVISVAYIHVLGVNVSGWWRNNRCPRIIDGRQMYISVYFSITLFNPYFLDVKSLGRVRRNIVFDALVLGYLMLLFSGNGKNEHAAPSTLLVPHLLEGDHYLE